MTNATKPVSAAVVIPNGQVDTSAAHKQPPACLPIDQIHVGPRHRKDLGDIPALAASIKQLGLLQPIPVRPDHQLIAGQRRLEAVKSLGWTEVPAVIVSNLDDALRMLQAERAENECRKDFAPSEAVAMGKAIEESEAPQAKKRQRQHGGTAPGRKKNTSGNLPEVNAASTTRDKAAEAVDMSPRTYAKAKAVVKAAKADPERFGPLVEQMDKTGKVDAAYQEVKRHSASKSKKQPTNDEPVKTEAGNGKVETLTISKPTTKADTKSVARTLLRFLGKDVCRELTRAWSAKRKPAKRVASVPRLRSTQGRRRPVRQRQDFFE